MFKYMIKGVFENKPSSLIHFIMELLKFYNCKYIVRNGTLYFDYVNYKTDIKNVTFITLLGNNEIKSVIRRLLWK